MTNHQPELAVTPGPSLRGDGPGQWRTSWRVDGDGQILETWLPHDHFHAPREQLDPPLALPATLERTVWCEDRHGTVIENAFLILRLSALGARRPEGGKFWRVFVRITIEIDPWGTPQQRCEAVTLQAIRAISH